MRWYLRFRIRSSEFLGWSHGFELGEKPYNFFYCGCGCETIKGMLGEGDVGGLCAHCDHVYAKTTWCEEAQDLHFAYWCPTCPPDLRKWAINALRGLDRAAEVGTSD
jgi:hypothetical protein